MKSNVLELFYKTLQAKLTLTISKCMRHFIILLI